MRKLSMTNKKEFVVVLGMFGVEFFGVQLGFFGVFGGSFVGIFGACGINSAKFAQTLAI